MRQHCKIQVKIENRNTRGVIIGPTQKLLVAEAEDAMPVVSDICRYLRKHPGIAVRSCDVAIANEGMAEVATRTFNRIQSQLIRRAGLTWAAA